MTLWFPKTTSCIAVCALALMTGCIVPDPLPPAEAAQVAAPVETAPPAQRRQRDTGGGAPSPGPIDPDPVDPGPVDPGPIDPGPVDPGPVDPGPDDPYVPPDDPGGGGIEDWL